MDERTARLASILEAAHRVHAVVTERTGGVDEDWPLFYAWWLITWSALPTELPRLGGIARLAADLVALDDAYRDMQPDVPWAEWYAADLAKRYDAQSD